MINLGVQHIRTPNPVSAADEWAGSHTAWSTVSLARSGKRRPLYHHPLHLQTLVIGYHKTSHPPVLHKGPSEASAMLCGSVDFSLLFHYRLRAGRQSLEVLKAVGFNLFSLILLEPLLRTIFLHGNLRRETDRNGVSLDNLLQKLGIGEESLKCNDSFPSPRMCKSQVYRVQRSDHRLD